MKKSYLVLFTISFLLMGCTLPWAKVENNKEEIIDDETVVAKDEGTGEMKKEKTNLETQGPIEDMTPSDTPKGIAPGGIYLPYTTTAVAQASGEVILFFHASWCPTCITINKDIEGNLKNIPKNITILKVNYDEAKDLREIYSVAGQYTFVQVDNSGKLIKKWRGGKTLQDALSQVEKTTESEIITTPENAPEPIVDKETTDPS